MRSFLLFVACFGALLLCTPAAAQSQTKPSMPDDIKAIVQKMKSGGDLTPAEETRMQDWAESMRSQIENSAQAVKPAAGSPGKLAGTAAGNIGSCPPAQAITLGAAAPARVEYVALVKSLAATYRLGAGQTRAKVDSLMATSPGPVAASEIGSLLLAAGAASASVYTSASAAAANPESPLLANNLGAALSAAGDQSTSVKVLLYAASLAPQSALIATNLGWSYFQAGQPGQAQSAFQRASSLSPNAAGPLGGMGLLAACRGDNGNAQKYLQASLDKRFSGTYAAALTKVKAAQGSGPGGASGASPGGSTGGTAGGDVGAGIGSGGDNSGSGAGPPPGGSGGEPKLIPALPDVEDAPHAAAAKAALDRVIASADKRGNALQQRLQDDMQRISQLSRRAHQDPGGALDVPILFDKELFQFRETWQLTFMRTFDGMRSRMAQSDSARETALEQMQAPEYGRRFLDLQKQELSLSQEMLAQCSKFSGDAYRACAAGYEQRIRPLKAEQEKLAYELCLKEKQMLDVAVAGQYKVYKPLMDNFRRAVDDGYAFTDPIVQRVYVPAWNDLLQDYREIAVMNVYWVVTHMAAGLAEQGQYIQHLKCVEPAPLPDENAKDPSLGKKKADCPRDPPKKVELKVPEALKTSADKVREAAEEEAGHKGFGGFKIEWGCDSLKIEGGEGLMASVEWNGAKKETTIWLGAGLSATADAIPGVKAGLEAKTGIGLTFGGQSGGLQDVTLTSEVSGEAKVAGHGFEGTFGTGMSTENGPSVTAKGQIEGTEFGGTYRNH